MDEGTAYGRPRPTFDRTLVEVGPGTAGGEAAGVDVEAEFLVPRTLRTERLLQQVEGVDVLHDDGVGATELTKGFGLVGMHERVQSLGGEVRITTAANRGFTLEVGLPG